MKPWLKIFSVFFFVAAMAGGVFLYYDLRPEIISTSVIENTEVQTVDEDKTVQEADEIVGDNEVKQDGTEQKEIINTPTKNQTGGGPVGNQGPYFHSLYFGTAADLDHWTLGETPIIEHASVPDLILLNKPVGSLSAGTLVTYFVDAHSGGGEEQVGMLSSSDNGAHWSDLADITVEGKPSGMKPVDPSIVQLDDGRLRLYFYDISGAAAGIIGPHSIYSAVSNDGINFVFEGEVFTSNASMTDPEVVYFNNTWLMYYAVGQNVSLAVSDDGLSFTDRGRINNVISIPGAIITDGQLNIFGCSNPVSYAVSSDGETFGSRHETTGIGEVGTVDFYCGPAPVLLEDGTFVMIIKWQGGTIR